MRTLAIDTHNSVKRLVASGFKEKQAEELVNIQNEANKEIIKVVDSAETISQEAQQDINDIRQDIFIVKKDIASTKQDILTIKQDVKDLKNNMGDVKSDVKVLKWMVGLIVVVQFVPLVKSFLG